MAIKYTDSDGEAAFDHDGGTYTVVVEAPDRPRIERTVSVSDGDGITITTALPNETAE